MHEVNIDFACTFGYTYIQLKIYHTYHNSLQLHKCNTYGQLKGLVRVPYMTIGYMTTCQTN